MKEIQKCCFFVDAARSSALKEVAVSIIDFQQCKEWYPSLEEGMLCAGQMGGGGDACYVSFI